MEITDEMLQAATRKAIEAGLLPRNAWRDDANGNRELMRLIVQAALAAMPTQPLHVHSDNAEYRRHPVRQIFPNAPAMERAVHRYSARRMPLPFSAEHDLAIA